ncbi:hypothetical protein [Bacillus sp. Marseille-Q1617]|uniref:hypothetical protein n=1 Tax=Bacillus sp. Marseille-Q1617 TaxID=2736887 RepID=UPI00158D1662|nr:hypothetical protein [Bacillus sp. Marseille-Q1617]
MKGRIVHEDSNTRIWLQEFNHPGEHTELLDNLKVSQEFNMRHRGLMEYYGKDLIAYKKEQMANKKRNEFLRTFSHYMTDHLEDDCPPSWKECPASFWEELIFAYLPHYTKIIPKKNYTETFLLQLRKFVRWLDKKEGTDFSQLVNGYINEVSPLLKKCEDLLNYFFLQDYPRFHQPDWDYEKDHERWEKEIEEYSETVNSLFQISEVVDEGVILKDIDTHHTYFTTSIPLQKISSELIFSGAIGKRPHELVWDWVVTESIYPERGTKYIQFAD